MTPTEPGPQPEPTPEQVEESTQFEDPERNEPDDDGLTEGDEDDDSA